jgi:hypothetical protein
VCLFGIGRESDAAEVESGQEKQPDEALAWEGSSNGRKAVDVFILSD